ncbi:DUF2157 domain-containing protein [bacterium]|jgi:hypothetical protein|nr:DUF2157 domain-containing protein [bacterium]MBT4552692.1 DUF2157 domain-containing protein [bacterium]
MSKIELLTYTKRALSRNYSFEQISSILSQQGWKIEEIKQAVIEAQESNQMELTKPLIAPKAPDKSKPLIPVEHLSASRILLYLGGLIVVLAGAIFIGINWSQWNPLMRILAIFSPMFICYLVGIKIFFSKEDEAIRNVFLTVGSLLFPFFLLITFKELQIFDKPFNDAFNFTVYLFSFALYLIQSLLFRFPVFAILYQIMGFFTYYFFLKMIGIESIFIKNTMAWLLLIPGTAYLFLTSIPNDLIQKKSFNIIGTLIIVFSFLRLFSNIDGKESAIWILFLFGVIYSILGLISHYGPYKKYSLTPHLIGSSVIALSLINFLALTYKSNKEHLIWVILLFGILYFIWGMFLEFKKLKKISQAPYIIGAATIFLFLLRLGLDGTLLKTFSTNELQASREIIGWSNFIIGMVYLLIAYILEKIRHVEITTATKFAFLFNIFGPLWILTSLLYLGLDGNKIFYESLLLLASLAFIFISIPRSKKSFLLFGTVFLVTYIFMIGGEYFKNEVGWPITLFVAGLLSMGIGIAIEKVRQRYFNQKISENIDN